MYNNMHSISDFASPTEYDLQKQAQLGDYSSSAPFRSPPFNAYPNNRSRQPSIPAPGPHTFRDTSNLSHHYPVDLYSTAPPPPSQLPHQNQPNSFDVIHQPRGGYDFPPGALSPPSGFAAGHNKPVFNVDPFGTSGLQTVKPNGIMPAPGSQQQQQVQGPQTQPPLNGFHPNPQAPYMNGIQHQQPQQQQQQPMQSQTPYGPHLPATNPSAPAPTQSNATHANGATQAAAQEEISTIFVVGFPEDMQEREFQNMFTFSAGFEAATLKIPNKELTAYGSGASGPGVGSVRPSGPLGYPHVHGGPNDPYNLVTINQGGVVVDGGRDGTTSSWPPADDQPFASFTANASAGGANANLSTRKQIIGFAKFRTRAEALEARDTLQGRRVDIEKGAVLKAEMAKKNLHTKRGIGPLPPQLSNIMGSGGGTVPPEALSGLPGIHGLHGGGPMPGGEPLAARERELGTLGAMGFTGLNGRRDTRVENREDDNDMRKTNALGMSGTRGARERAEEEERKRKETSEADRTARLRSNNPMSAFDAFHSVPSSQQPVGNSLLAATAGENPSMPGGPGGINGFATRGSVPNPWSMAVSRENGLPGFRKMSAPAPSGLPARPLSPGKDQQSPPPNKDVSIFPSVDAFSPNSSTGPLPHPSLPTRPRQISPVREGEGSGSMPTSSASSVADSLLGGSEESMPDALASLAISTERNIADGFGSTSPPLGSPDSGASSARSGAVDQNPPINTLYVGNLPSSPPPPGQPPNQLEESLRELFQRRPGFRKLCFRQKSNGPMCFVEFADVSYATRALNDLYGATLNGLVKGGGIRLSYSKNPLGVRTPTNASNGTNTPATDGSVPIKSLAELDTSVRSRRDGSGMVSPTSSYQFSMSPPPPRFVSPPPVNASFGPGAFPRSMGAQSFGMASPTGSMSPSSSTPTFSPFGISPSPQLNPIGNNHLTTIPEQSNTFNNHNHASSYISDPEQHSSANAMSALSHDSS